MSKCIGIIAEDKSDYEVFKILAKKISKKSGIGFRPSLAHGCGRMRAKCLAWADDLFRRGCEFLIIAQDSDGNSAEEIKRTLENALNTSKISIKIVIIPIVEIEAWLLADENAIKDAFKFKSTPKRIHNPESLEDPKRDLKHLIDKHSNGHIGYLNTAHNHIIASQIKISNLRRCKSFLPLENFINSQVNH